MKVLILGYRGYLGSYFAKQYPDHLLMDADVTDRKQVAYALDTGKPDVVINCAGKTGRPNVDWCEDHPMETLSVNVTGALIVMEECVKRSIYLVNISSGCIYAYPEYSLWARQHGFSETDAPNFFGSFYSRTKAWSDQIMQEFPVLNLRLRMPFDGTTNPRNLIMKIREYKRVLTEQNSMTHIPEFISTAAALIDKRITGTFNVVNEGVISPYDIMKMYKEIVDPDHTCDPLEVKYMGEVARAGRSNCRLGTDKLKELDLGLSDIRVAVEQALRGMKGKV